jgi:ABC-2 type transport system permease protein
MKQFLVFVRKEIAHVFRDRKSLLMLFGLPVAQIILFGFALSNEVKEARIAIVDGAHDAASIAIAAKLNAGKSFDVVAALHTVGEAEAAFKRDDIRLAVIFPAGFYNDLLHLHHAQVQLITDASDPNTATTLAAYAGAIIQEYSAGLMPQQKEPYRIITQTRMLYNPQLKGAHNFVPGVMALVLMLICVMMTSISIVREKELGTMEVLLVSPFRPVLVLFAKAVPYLLISLFNLGIILLLSIFLLGLPVKGSLFLLIGESTLFIITSLSLGLLISTRTASQQTAMLLSLMGMMLPTILFTGFMFPIENMPLALQLISHLVPARWYYAIVKSIMIKCLGLDAILKETLVLAGMAVFFLALSLKSFKTRLA